jgi:hypothetical protein
MQPVDINRIVLLSLGTLPPNANDATGYSLSAEGLL